MKLTYLTFQGCRHLDHEVETLLSVLVPTLEDVRERGVLVLTVPDSRIEKISKYYTQEIVASSEMAKIETKNLHESSHQLLDLCCIAANELTNLFSIEARGAVQSLGYALHIIPDLVTSGQALDIEGFNFNFRIAAFHWKKLSTKMRWALANVAGLELERVNTLVYEEDYTIDMFG